jgi:hypothetical protein
MKKGTDGISPTFQSLNQESIVIEGRYPFSYLFWDSAGNVFHTIKEKLPTKTLEVRNAQPGSVSVVYDERYEITVESMKTAVGCVGHKIDLKEFENIASTIFDLVIKTLEIGTFERLGLRQVFVKKYSSMKKVHDALGTIPSTSFLMKTMDTHKDKILSPGVSLRMEDDKSGTLFSLKAVTRDFEFDIPPIFRDEGTESQQSLHQSLLMMDIDTYTLKEMLVGQVRLSDWIAQGLESVKRDAELFF